MQNDQVETASTRLDEGREKAKVGSKETRVTHRNNKLDAVESRERVRPEMT